MYVNTYVCTYVSLSCHQSLLYESQAPVLGVTQSEITEYTLNYKLTNESDYSQLPVAAPRTWARVPGVQLGRRYDAFVTATNGGGQSNASETLTLSKQCM